jgi:hypothetical protein
VGEFAYNLDKAFWLISLLLLAISMIYKLDISSRIALSIWVVGNLVMDQLQPFIMDLSTSNKTVGPSLWYVTWASIEVLCIWCIHKTHAVYELPASKFARYIMVCFLSLCALQLMRYADRVVFETNLLAAVYKYVVVSINISVVPFAMLWLIREIRADKKGIVL